MGIILVEDVPERPDALHGDVVVAMTPRAADRLTLEGIAHTSLAEIASEAEIGRLEHAYWPSQLAWLEELDRWLRDALPTLREHEITPATLYAYHLKILLDNVWIRGFEAAAVLALAPSGVVLLTAAADEPPLDETLVFRGPSVLSRVLPLLAEARGIPFRAELVPPAAVTRPREAFGRRVANRLRRRRPPVREEVSPKADAPTLLFLHEGYDLSHLDEVAAAHGSRRLALEGTRVVDRGRGGIVVADLSDLDAPRGDWHCAAAAIAADEQIWAWPNGWFDAPLARVIAPRVAHWVREVLPLVAARTAAFDRIYRDESVDFVVTPFMVGATDAAALAAARTSVRTSSVVIQHGDDVFDGDSWDIHYLLNYDHYFATSSEAARHFEARARRLQPRPTAASHVGSYRWQSLARRPRPQSGHAPPLVVYVPAPMHGDTRYLNTGTYGDAWYWGVQQAIVDTLVSDDRYRVCVKLFPGEPKRSSPLAEYAGRLAPRVEIARGRFVEDVLPDADRVIVDAPSTSLYETVLAGVPVLGLYFREVDVRPSAVAQFGAQLVPFETPGDAAAAVQAFLDTKEPAVPELSLEGDDIYATLAQLRRGADR